MKKAARGDLQPDLHAMRDIPGRYLQSVEGLHGALGLAHGRAERREIVAADQPIRGSLHRTRIEHVAQVPDLAPPENRRGTTTEDAVSIAPPFRREPRMPVRIVHLRGGENGDGRRPEMGVQSLQ